VKGTQRGKPHFYMSDGEVRFSQEHADRYALVIVYNVDLEACTHEIFWHEGQVSTAEFELTPVQWCGIPAE
jgi:hypothetical protein